MIDKIVLDFFEDMEKCPQYLYEENDIFSEMIWYSKKWKNKVKVKNGCSKFVIIFNDLDYVIKVPMNSCYNEDYCPEEYWDEECEGCPYDYDESYAQEIWEFENGGSRYSWDNYWDYCALEEQLGKSAIEKGLEFIVLPTTYLGEIKGYRLYKQPKIERVWGWKKENIDEKSKEKVKNYESKVSGAAYFQNSFVLAMINTFSENFCEKFFNWIEKNKINDLHSENYGIRNGHPVVFDYSGFSS